MGSEEHVSIQIPSILKYISSNEEVRFDDVEEHTLVSDKHQLTDLSSKEIEIAAVLAISIPSSPMEVQYPNTKGVPFSLRRSNFNNGVPNSNSAATKHASSSRLSEEAESQPQPLPQSSVFEDQAIQIGHFPYQPSIGRPKDKRFDNFKTWSGKHERQISLASLLRGKPPRRNDQPENASVQSTDQVDPLPADRYFDALEGPELDTLRTSEEILLPEDKKWPFLLRYTIASFSVCLGVGSQAILWKTLPTSASTKFLHLSLTPNFVLWFISLALLVISSCIYILKVIFYFEAVRREYFHPIRINFFFAPFIALLFLAIGVPPSICDNLYPALWYILMAPILCFELKIYGQWMLGGQSRLSKVANPVNHLSIVGNFVGALLGASMGLREGPIFFFAVGLAHYIVLFVTLYQRLTTNESVIPRELHPVFFLFIAAPCVASMAWARIQGSFDYGSRISYFIAMFLYLSLAVRANFFRGFKFSMAWWAYTFPMTSAAIATIRYSNEVTNVATQAMAVILSLIATLTVMTLFVVTVLHAFVLRDLFPNDIAIAISDRNPNKHKKWYHLKQNISSRPKDIENSLKPTTNSEKKDLEFEEESSIETTKL